jgi:hypothetical protein
VSSRSLVCGGDREQTKLSEGTKRRHENLGASEHVRAADDLLHDAGPTRDDRDRSGQPRAHRPAGAENSLSKCIKRPGADHHCVAYSNVLTLKATVELLAERGWPECLQEPPSSARVAVGEGLHVSCLNVSVSSDLALRANLRIARSNGPWAILACSCRSRGHP